MEGDSGIVMEDVCGDDMRNLGERLVLMLMRAGILVGGVVVVVVAGVMAMVEVGVVSFSEGRCLPVAEVEFVVVGCGLMGGNFLKFAGGFVVVVVVETVVGGSKLEVVAVVRIVWSKWGAALFVATESKVSRREDVQCWWESLWCSDTGRFFDGVFFGGGDWFNRECGGSQNACWSGREHGIG